MVDNGMFEEGKPLSPEALFDVAKELKPDVVFAPDQVGDMSETMHMTHHFIDLCRYSDATWKVGVIPQGRDAYEVVECHDRMLREMCFEGPIGISFLNDRPKIVNFMTQHKRWRESRWYHFLGMYSLSEIPTWPAGVKSMDTIKPFKAAMHGYTLEDCPRGLGKWNTRISMPEENVPLMYENYRAMYRALRRSINHD